MPIERCIDESTNVLWTTMIGPITFDDIRGHMAAVHAMDGQRHCEVIDTRQATVAFAAKQLPKLASYGRQLFGHGAMAPRTIVVDRKEVVYFGVARLFAALAAPWVTVRVFDNLQAAEAFVNALIAVSR